MSCDFDTVLNRQGTSCLKYDFEKQRTGRTDLLPMWVADMDFRAPDCVLDALKRRTEHGIFGYTDPDDSYFDAMENWFLTRYGLSIQREWNTVTPGVVYAIACAVRAFTKPGEKVLIQEPVYYPFRETIELNGRVCVSSSLIRSDSEDLHYEMRFDDLAQKLADPDVHLMLLCSPHNPVGRVWSADELRKVSSLCRENGVVLLSDEIHCDFILPGHHFTSVLALGEAETSNAVVCTSASKSFNLSGLQVANILVPDSKLRKAFRHENAASGYSQGNAAGLTATEAAWRGGAPWLDSLLQYLNGNLEFVRSYLRENLPGIRLVEPEGTYLLLLDFSGICKTYEELHDLVQNKAKLWFDEGRIFGPETALFERINIACPRCVLKKALGQLKDAVQDTCTQG